MRMLILTVSLFLAIPSLLHAENGLISLKSKHDAKTTAERLISLLETKKMTVFARIDHAASAEKIGKPLRPTELIIFGKPQVGTPFMQCGQTVGIDLPQKALIWTDENKQTWLSYNDPHYVAKRHGVENCKEVINKIAGALNNFAKKSTE